jgi:hypothetical protein
MEKYWLPAGLGILLLFTAINALSTTVADPDLWCHLAFGRLFWESGTFPCRDVFSFVPTLEPWFNHEWLSGVLFYAIYRQQGAAGLQLLKFGLALLTVLFLYLSARRRGADPFSAVVVLWVILPVLRIGYSPVRAQAFTFAFFALTVFLLEKTRLQEGWRGLWLLVPLQILWCNLHGGFLTGLGLIGLYALGEALARRRFAPYAGILMISALATLINPYGLVYWRFLLRVLAEPLPEIIEWWPVFKAYQFGGFHVPILFFLISAIFAGLLLWRVRRREFTPFLALAVVFIPGFLHLRHIVFFLLLATAYLPAALTSYMQSAHGGAPWRKLKERLTGRTPALLVLFLVLYYGWAVVSRGPLKLELPPCPGKGSLYYPLGAVEFIKERRLTGNLLTGLVEWGGYLMWTLWPQCRVAPDGRYEAVYPEADFRVFYQDFVKARGDWQRLLERCRPDMVLVRTNSSIYERLHQSSWLQIYADTDSALFLREDKLPPPLLKKVPDA